MAAENVKVRRTVRGTVVSNAMQKTIVVEAERLVSHKKYRKFMRKYTRYYAHDEDNKARVGDFVELAMTRPLSKKKRWTLEQIVREAPQGALEGIES